MHESLRVNANPSGRIGCGAFLLFGHQWADREATLKSYELFARYVMPAFQGQLDPLRSSYDWITGSGGEFVGRASGAINKAIADHAAEKEARATP